MIFSRLFQPAHQHSDPKKRLASVADLDPHQEKDKQILHELAFNDESIEVAIAALDALDSFTLWLKAYETHFKQKVQQVAKGAILKLVEDSNAVSDALLTDIAKQSKHNVLLREMVFSSQRFGGMHALCVQTLLNICTDSDVRRFFAQSANDAQKYTIIDSVDEKTLRRFKKLDNSLDVVSYIDDKLSALALAAEKPVKLIAAATLINSRLLAISELMDYESIQQQKQALIIEFEALKSEFSVLSDEASAQLTSKYFSIKERVDKRLSQLEPDYRAHLHLSGVTDAIADVQNRANTIFQQIDILTETDSPEQLSGQIELLERSIADLRLELADISGGPQPNDSASHMTAAHRATISKLEAAFVEHHQVLASLPEAIARNAQIDALLVQAKALMKAENTHQLDAPEIAEMLTEDAPSIPKTTLKIVIKQLDELSKSGINTSRAASVKAIKKTLSDQRKAHTEEAKRLEKRCFAKLNVCLKMIEQGKFKVAISTFNAAKKLVEQLNAKSTSLVRRYDDVHEKIRELKDWQSYIATPKKPALIAATITLADNQHIDIAERSRLVKQYRAEFMTLGRLHTEQDDRLNKEFDIAIEKAFAPCRRYFANLEDVREQNLQKGQQILAALEALDDVEDTSILAKHISAISQQYRKLGDLDKQARSQLHKAYQNKLKPLQNRVNAVYETNAVAKQNLILSAQKLSESEDIESAVNAAKRLQTEWKSLGFAGSKKDQALWQSFRMANDAIFARLQDTIAEQKQSAHLQVKAIQLQLEELGAAVSQAEQLNDLNKADVTAEEISVQIQALPRAHQQAQMNKLVAHKATLLHKVKSLETIQQNTVIENVFSTLSAYQEELTVEQLGTLPSPFRQAFEQSNKPSKVAVALQGMSRKELSMSADILLANGGGYAESAEKKNVQLKLMAAKLEGQIMPDADALLVAWISAGVLKEGDIELLTKFKTLYMSTLHSKK